MKRTITLLLALTALVASPSAGADAKERSGARINLLAGAFQVFPAGEPFHVAHGWFRVLGEDLGTVPALGRYGFSLAVDGLDDPADYVERAPTENPVFGRIKVDTPVHNFPDGLMGTHTFTGHWFGPCAGVVEGGYAPGPCEHPAEITTAIAPLTITDGFMP